MKLRTIIALLCVIALFGFTLAGCGGQQETGKEPSQEPGEKPAEEPGGSRRKPEMSAG